MRVLELWYRWFTDMDLDYDGLDSPPISCPQQSTVRGRYIALYHLLCINGIVLSAILLLCYTQSLKIFRMDISL